MNRLKKFILSGMLLTAVSFLMRAVSVSYNVYISNLLGAETMGIFTLINTVYGFAITVAIRYQPRNSAPCRSMGREANDALFENAVLRDIVKMLYIRAASPPEAALFFIFSRRI